MQRKRVIFDIAEPIGLFATLYYVAALVRACEEQGVDPWIEATSPFYRDASRGPDWFAYYFDRRQGVTPPTGECSRHRIRSRRKLNKLTRGNPHVDMQNEFDDFRDVGRLFDRHLQLKQELHDAAAAYADEHFGERTLGVHWRGGDKRGDEADPIPRALMREVLTRHAADCDTLFIATDEPEFRSWARTAFPDHRVIAFSTPSERPFSERWDDDYQKGREAILDCLLLSMCDRMVKTPSALSAWSKVFNPALPVVLVGQPYKQHLRLRVRLPGFKLRFRRWLARPLRHVGYCPENVLHDPNATERNGVLEIVPTADGPIGRRYH